MVPLVATLVHSSCKESGSIFEAAAGHYSKIRWERSKGLLLKPDESLTPSALLKAWPKVRDFANADHPNSVSQVCSMSTKPIADVQQVADSMALLEKAQKLPSNAQGDTIHFAGKVALVTGGA